MSIAHKTIAHKTIAHMYDLIRSTTTDRSVYETSFKKNVLQMTHLESARFADSLLRFLQETGIPMRREGWIFKTDDENADRRFSDFNQGYLMALGFDIDGNRKDFSSKK